jgi:hypothetical protein
LIILIISTHGGKDYEVEVESYNPAQMNDDLNNREINTVVIGDVILARIDIKSISKKEI